MRKNSHGSDVTGMRDLNGLNCGPWGHFFGTCGDNRTAAKSYFYDLVKPGAIWDHKPTILKMWNSDQYATDPITGKRIFYDIFSNLHYGYIGSAAGFYEAEIQVVNYLPSNRFTGQREKSDVISTQIGIDLFTRLNGDDILAIPSDGEITTALVYQAIMAHQSDYASTGERKIV